MSFSSGTFSINSTGQPVVTGTVISSTTHNALTADIATGLSTCVLKDGTQTITANIPMSSFKLTGLGSGSARTDSINVGQVEDGFPNYVGTVGGTADVITLTPAPAITSYTAGKVFRFIASGANTTNVTVNVSGVGARALTKNGSTALVANDIPSGALVEITDDGTRFQLGNVVGVGVATAETITGAKTFSGNNTYSGSSTFSGNVALNGDVDVGGAELADGAAIVAAAGGASVVGWVPRGHISGLTLSNNGSDAANDVDISVGECSDSTNVCVMKLASSITKRIDASWAAGTNQGGLDGTESVAGTPDTSTWYHVWMIRKDSDGSIDALFSESATSPTMPSGYTYKRRVGSVYNNSSGDIKAFVQVGEEFLWKVPDASYSANNPGTSSVGHTTLTPLGVQTLAIYDVSMSDNSPVADTNALVTSPSTTDTAPSGTLHDLKMIVTGGGAQSDGAEFRTLTSTSSTVRVRLDNSDAGIDVVGITKGWVDMRGRFD